MQFSGHSIREARMVTHCGVEQKAARMAHNHEVVGSSPTPATHHHQFIITMENVLFSKKQFAGTRCYHFDAREDVNGDPYLQIVEVPTAGSKGKRQRIFVHAQDLEKFKESIIEVIDQCIERFGENVNES